jgi:hypothetical protein
VRLGFLECFHPPKPDRFVLDLIKPFEPETAEAGPLRFGEIEAEEHYVRSRNHVDPQSAKILFPSHG